MQGGQGKRARGGYGQKRKTERATGASKGLRLAHCAVASHKVCPNLFHIKRRQQRGMEVFCSPSREICA